ncbi:hypothetical protein BJ912DRAFT_1075314 [Pholiota molesta]|nr:hypothetical protein BJ912DRAFT_1075314 [Pholiota molesta]
MEYEKSPNECYQHLHEKPLNSALQHASSAGRHAGWGSTARRGDSTTRKQHKQEPKLPRRMMMRNRARVATCEDAELLPEDAWLAAKYQVPTSRHLVIGTGNPRVPSARPAPSPAKPSTRSTGTGVSRVWVAGLTGFEGLETRTGQQHGYISSSVCITRRLQLPRSLSMQTAGCTAVVPPFGPPRCPAPTRHCPSVITCFVDRAPSICTGEGGGGLPQRVCGGGRAEGGGEQWWEQCRGEQPAPGQKKDTAALGGVVSGQAGGNRERDREERQDRECGERERGERVTRSRRGNVPPARQATMSTSTRPATLSTYIPAQLLKLHTTPMNASSCSRVLRRRVHVSSAIVLIRHCRSTVVRPPLSCSHRELRPTSLIGGEGHAAAKIRWLEIEITAVVSLNSIQTPLESNGIGRPRGAAYPPCTRATRGYGYGLRPGEESQTRTRTRQTRGPNPHGFGNPCQSLVRHHL